MALNFLKHKIVPVLMVKTKAMADGDMVTSSKEEDMGLEEACEEIILAMRSGSKSKMASALRSAFQILDSEPHEEGEHTDEEENI